MAVSRNDAQKIIDKYFRLPEVHPGGRKYYFPINDVTPSNIQDLLSQLYYEGSEIRRDEIVRFINQEDWESKESYIRLPLIYMVLGEVLTCDLDLNGERIFFTAVKLSKTYYLTNLGNVVNINENEVCEEQNVSPFFPEAKVMSLALLKPSPNFRLIDQIYLSERYAESKPENALILYNVLADLFRSNEISSQWDAIVNTASESGISLFTVFKILEIFLISKTE